MSLFFFTGVPVNEQERQIPTFKVGIISLAAVMVLLLLIWYRNSHLSVDLLSHFTSWKEEQVHFKNIFDNIEDPVIIYQDHTCKFANDTFLDQFKIPILEAQLTIEESS
jgi:hypothetical protein